MPFQLWNWEIEIGAPLGAMSAWREFDTEGEIAAISPYPVTLCNDATAACAAEFFFGRSWRYRDFMYFFLGAFVGGGMVLDGALRPGRTGNAGAVGSMPVAARDGDKLRAPAHRARLDLPIGAPAHGGRNRCLRQSGRRPRLGANSDRSSTAGSRRRPSALAYASAAAISIVDFEAIVIDGAMPAIVRDRLTARTAQVFLGLDRRGLSEVEFASGAVGADARAIGGAALPLIKNFARDREVLFKDAMSQAS